MWETDLTCCMCLPDKGGHFKDTYLSSSKSVVPKLCCKLESPKELLNLPLSRLHPKPIKSEFLGAGPDIRIFKTLQVIAMGSQVCKAMTYRRMDSIQTKQGSELLAMWRVPAIEAAQT